MTISPPGTDRLAAQPQQTVAEVTRTMPVTAAHYRAVLALLLLFGFESWEMLALVYTGESVQRTLGIDDVGLGQIISAMFIGMIPGMLFWGAVADRIGRRRSLLISMGAYCAVALVSAAMPTFLTLWIARFVGGVFMSGAFLMLFPLFEELSPVRGRGRLAVYLASGAPVGTLLAVGAAHWLGGYGFRAILAATAITVLWVPAVRAWVPESPFWLASKGRCAEAKATLTKLGAVIPDDVVIVAEPSHGKYRWRELATGGLLGLTVLQIVVNFAYSWGYWGLQTWLPQLLAERGLSSESSLGFIALSALFMFPGYLVAAALTERFGRKWVFAGFVFGAIVGGVVFATASGTGSLYSGMFCTAFFGLGAWGVWDVWLGELYGLRTRAKGYAVGVLSQRVGNSLSPAVTGLIFATTASFALTTGSIVLILCVALLASLGLPERAGQALH